MESITVQLLKTLIAKNTPTLEIIGCHYTCLSKYQSKFSNILDVLNTLLFSIQLNACKMTVQKSFTSVDFQCLIQKLAELKGAILSQRRVDVELSSAIGRLLTDLQQQVLLSQFSGDSSELLRLLNCCFDLLTESIRGKNC